VSAGVEIPAAFLGGVVSFLSPCVLPLIPSYITFITGLSLEDAKRARATALLHSALFVIGFTIVFLLLGATATALGMLLRENQDLITRIGGVMMIVFGLYLVGAFNIAFLSQERRLHIADKPMGYLGSVLVGITFGAGWTPCIGPILGSIYMYTASAADFNRGMVLLTSYSLGLAVPFLLAAVLLSRFLEFFTRIKSTMLWVSRGAGVLLILIGLLMVTNRFTLLSNWLQGLTPDFMRKVL
jgi:cytochrome c-type biogenesis protein